MSRSGGVASDIAGGAPQARSRRKPGIKQKEVRYGVAHGDRECGICATARTAVIDAVLRR